MSNRSILWLDRTLNDDKSLVEFLVNEFVTGKDVPGHYEHCVNKILGNIQADNWKSKYASPATFVFSVFYAVQVKTILEIKLSLHAQALELLYFYMSGDKDEGDFSNKIRYVFREIYQWEMPPKTANAIRILRNDVAHTGTIQGVHGAYRNPKDPQTLEDYFVEFDFNANQNRTNIQNRMSLGAEFCYLVQDILMRILGLDQDDLKFNGRPAWLNPIFGYDHTNRPDWLRESKSTSTL